MIPNNTILQSIMAHPVSLEPLPIHDINNTKNRYVNLRIGDISEKNQRELDHFIKTFRHIPAEQKSYADKISTITSPKTNQDTIILDIGCGPYDCISTLTGTHIFLDDIMNLYVDELQADHNGLRVCARTELMPFADDAIDILYSVNMIDHVDDMPETLYEMHRILKPEGFIYIQSYYNSHPLLMTEPGVFDFFFIEEYIKKYFNIEYLDTFAIGDPKISSSYTMDVIGCVLSKKNNVEILRKDRRRYTKPEYFGPQSRISMAIDLLEKRKPDKAKIYIESIQEEEFYNIHYQLLNAWWNILIGELGIANISLKEMLMLERVRKNPFCRIAVLQLENKRITAATNKE